MNDRLHPDAGFTPVSVSEALGSAGWISYRCRYSVGSVEWDRHSFEKPCLSIRANWNGWKPNIGGAERRFTISEVKRLHSYPPGASFSGSYSAIWRLIGNSVPPLVMMAVAGHVRESVLEVVE